MTVLPVIGRELRAAARQGFTYYLRTLGAGAVVVASVMFGVNDGFEAHFGGRLFGHLHMTMFWGIWILAPWLTADCISRERREGTLGLLFLTRLRGTDIVIAKSVAHGLRALTLWVAVMPVLTIPFLLGGVSWRDCVLSVLINFEALCCALAAGLLASAWNTAWLRALAVSAVLAVTFLFTLALGTAWMLLDLLGAGSGLGPGPAPWSMASSDYILATGFGFLASSTRSWAGLLRLLPTGKLLWGTAQMAGVSLLVLVGAIVMAGARTRRSWQQAPPSERQRWWRATFCTPVLWLGLFRRWLRWKLERNPIGWLEQRTWTGRLVTWGWFAVIISLYTAVLSDRRFFSEYHKLQTKIAWLLAGSVAMSAAGSFRRERVSGVLELLLVSPLGEGEILWGRLRGLWGQFLPSVGLLLGIWGYFSTFSYGSNEGGSIVFFVATFFTLPVIGLYFSLRCRSFISAFLAALAVGLLVPMVGASALWVIWGLYFGTESYEPEIIAGSGRAAVVQVFLAAWYWYWLVRRLKRRQFPLERTIE